MPESSTEVVRRYLEDAIAAESNFITQLKGFANEGDNQAARAAFEQHRIETENQHERLVARLKELGGTPSTTKSVLAHIFGLSPKAASVGHEKEERTTQNLMMAYAVENSEIAMYESLATVADAAGDSITAELARSIQKEEAATADKIWQLIPSAAIDAYNRLIGGSAAATSAHSTKM
jgi:ferritin-like metal-binding protein YciE